MATTYRNYKRLDNSDKFFDKKTGDIISRDTYEKLFLSEHKDKIQYATVEQPRPRRTPVHEGTIKKEGLAEFNSNLGSLFGGRDFASRTKRAILTMGLSEEKGRKIYSDMIGNAALLSTGGGGIVADALKFGALKFGTEMFTHGDAREAGKEAFWEAGAIGALGLLGKVGSAIYHSPVGRRVAAVVGATTYGIGAASQIPTQTKEEREAALDWKQIMTDIQSSANPVPASASVPLEAVLRVRQASKAGDTNRFANSRNFLATDKVPDTIFGIPIVSKREDYTEEDIAFFKEHPEAGGYYDLGDSGTGTPEDGTAEGAPVQADVPKRGKYPGIANNPGNVEKHERRSDKTLFDGEVGGGKRPKRFANFNDPVKGLHAAAAVLARRANELEKAGRSFTLENYIPRYAPKSENDTEGYIRNMSRYTGFARNATLDRLNVDDMAKLLRNVVRFESGKPHSDWFTDEEYRSAAKLLQKTEEKQRMDAHRAGQKALADSLDRIGESRRKKGAK